MDEARGTKIHSSIERLTTNERGAQEATGTRYWLITWQTQTWYEGSGWNINREEEFSDSNPSGSMQLLFIIVCIRWRY